MKPYFERDGITLYHDDCREVLPTLAAGSVDLVLTDPPYGMQMVNFSRMPHHSRRWAGQENVKGDGARQGVRLTRAMLFEATDALRDDAHVYVFCHWESWPDFYDAVSSYLPIRGALICSKNSHGPGNFQMDYMRDYEVVLYGARGARPLEGGLHSSVLRDFDSVRGAEKTHPTEKPVELLRYFVERSCPGGGLVVDPFAGTGATLLACRQAGRQGIGIELSEAYCEIAARRLSQQVLPFYTAEVPDPAPPPTLFAAEDAA